MKSIPAFLIITFTLSFSVAFGQEFRKPKTELSDQESKEDLLNRLLILPQMITSSSGFSNTREFSRDEAVSLYFDTLRSSKLPGLLILSNCTQLKNGNKVTFYVRTSLGHILKTFELAYPDYRLELRSGVLNLSTQDDTSKLLDEPIKEFRAENATTSEALSILLDKPEVKAKKIETGLDKAVLRLHISSSYDPENKIIVPRSNFNLENTTFRAILNEIAKNTGQHPLYYVERHCGERSEFEIY